MANVIECVECGAEIELTALPLVGEIISCPDCGVELEVTSVNPLTVELAPEVEEDWGE
jgi:alpha-aminoadipate carrier protein LysW